MSYYNQGGGGGAYGGGSGYNQPPGGGGYNAGGQHQGYAPNNDPNAWQQPPQQQAPAPQQQQQHGHYGAPAPSNSYGYASQPQDPGFQQFLNTGTVAATKQIVDMAFSTPGGQDAMMKMGANFLDQSTAKMIPGLEMFMQSLRKYFAVDHAYVIAKMKRISFPFLTKNWIRQQKEVAPTPDNRIPPPAYELPINDECAPDLYIPLMSAVTYVLLSAVLYGAAGKFEASIISTICTRCLLLQVVTVAAMRCALYALDHHQQQAIQILDLFCYAGYQYTGLCWNLLVAVLFRQVGVQGSIWQYYYVTLAYTAAAAGFFLLKTFSNAIPQNGSPTRNAVVLAFAASPFLTMWLVSPTRVL